MHEKSLARYLIPNGAQEIFAEGELEGVNEEGAPRKPQFAEAHESLKLSPKLLCRMYEPKTEAVPCLHCV